MQQLPDEHILIIDDAQANLMQLKMILEMHGYHVDTADSGVAAIHSAINSPPDIILLDINMPEFNGYDVCSFLKNYEETEDIPVIFISGYSDAEDILKAFANGGIDFIAKPFHVDEVIARINSHLVIKRLKRELALQVEELQEFAAMIAHDIKGPLGIVSGYANQLNNHWGSFNEEEQQHMIGKIQQHAGKSTQIVDEMLKMAVISQEEIDIKPVDMSQVIDQVKRRISPSLAQFGGSVDYGREWPNVYGHAPWIEEVWVNYISNALKYGGQPAMVELGYTPISNQYIKFWVKDHGPGLTPEQQELVFLKYKRLHKKGQPKGHGLGLSIVKRIITKLMGDVGIESAPGEGSTFTFTLRAT